MKFRAHETFYIRKNWLGKGLKYVVAYPDLFTSRERNPMDVLGIGSNMVKSLRYWLPATGLTQEKIVAGKRLQELTAFGQLVKQYDPYTEELGTLWLLHYNLVKDKDAVTSWYYFFNSFQLSEFNKDDFTSSLLNYVRLEGEDVSIRSLDDDFNCVINTYLPRYKSAPGKEQPENNMECPLSELGLIDIQSRSAKTYKKTAPLSQKVPIQILIAVILDNAHGRTEIPLDEIKNGIGNVGKVFNLDSITLMALLSTAETQGYVKVIRTAGLDVLHLLTGTGREDLIASYYQNLA